MKIVVFGATGPSGQALVKLALQRGIHVTALVRNPGKLSITHENLMVKKVNIFDEDEIQENINDCDVVFGCLGSTGSCCSRKQETIYTESTETILSAMRKAGKKRYIVMSASGVIKSPQEPFLIGVGRTLKIGKLFENIREMEIALENTNDIDFTAVRAPILNNKAVTDKEILTEVNGLWVRGTTSPFIARSDVARFMLDIAENGKFKREIVAIAT